MIDKLKNKKGIFVFSDPAGAKACLALGKLLNNPSNLFISNRKYNFYNDFNINVIDTNEFNFEEYLESHNTDFIFTGTSFPDKIELQFIQEANRKQITSYSFVDHNFNIKLRFEFDNNYIYPDKILVISEEAKMKAISENIPEEKIQIITNPYYNYLRNWLPIYNYEEILSKLNLTENQSFILFAPEPLSKFQLDKKYGFTESSGLRHLINLNNNVNCKIIVKFHPNQDPLIFEEFQNLENVILIKNDTIDLNHLIHYSKAVFGYFSNSMIEASILNTKLFRILIDIVDKNLDPLFNMNIGTIIYSKTELSKTLINL